MSFIFKSGDKIRWPNKCAYCGEIAEDEAPVSNTAAIAFYGVAYKEESFSMMYPVCKKHKRLCAILDWPASLGFINTSLLALILPMLLCLGLGLIFCSLTGLKGEIVSFFFLASGFFIYAGTFIYLVLTIIKKPIRIIRKENKPLVIKFNNKKFYRDFVLLNSRTSKL